MKSAISAADSLSKIYLPDKIGRGYGTMWRSKCRYIAIKGSRRSKKSKTQAQKLIYQIVKYPQANGLVVRRYYNTLRDSCFAELKWAVRNLGLEEFFQFKESPLEVTYKPTGQKIFFRGLDDALKITSITVEYGALCFLWVEEAFEIEDEAEFEKLEQSLLGYCPPGHFKQITLTFNPWSESTWIKARFFDVESPDILAMTTNYMCNEWLSDEDRKVFEEMKKNRPGLYWVAGLGNWGIDGAVYFEEFDRDIHVVDPFLVPDHWKIYRAMDYGLDALACLYIAVDTHDTAYVIGEVYAHNLIISDAAEAIRAAEVREQRYTTYAPPDLWSRTKDTGRTIDETFAKNGVPLDKSNNARVPGWLQIHERLKLIDDVDGTSKTARLKIFSNCKNLIRCISTIKADEKDCNDVATQPHELTHIVDALRYFCVMHTLAPREIDRRTEEEKFLSDFKASKFKSSNSKSRVVRYK